MYTPWFLYECIWAYTYACVHACANVDACLLRYTGRSGQVDATSKILASGGSHYSAKRAGQVVCIYTYIRMNMYTCVHTNTYIQMYSCMHIFICRYMCMLMYKRWATSLGSTPVILNCRCMLFRITRPLQYWFHKTKQSTHVCEKWGDLLTVTWYCIFVNQSPETWLMQMKHDTLNCGCTYMSWCNSSYVVTVFDGYLLLSGIFTYTHICASVYMHVCIYIYPESVTNIKKIANQETHVLDACVDKWGENSRQT